MPASGWHRADWQLHFPVEAGFPRCPSSAGFPISRANEGKGRASSWWSFWRTTHSTVALKQTCSQKENLPKVAPEGLDVGTKPHPSLAFSFTEQSCQGFHESLMSLPVGPAWWDVVHIKLCPTQDLSVLETPGQLRSLWRHRRQRTSDGW
jgi:hypothetical protein